MGLFHITGEKLDPAEELEKLRRLYAANERQLTAIQGRLLKVSGSMKRKRITADQEKKQAAQQKIKERVQELTQTQVGVQFTQAFEAT